MSKQWLDDDVRTIVGMINVIPGIGYMDKSELIRREWAFAADLKTIPTKMGITPSYRARLYYNADNYDIFIKTSCQPS